MSALREEAMTITFEVSALSQQTAAQWGLTAFHEEAGQLVSDANAAKAHNTFVADHHNAKVQFLAVKVFRAHKAWYYGLGVTDDVPTSMLYAGIERLHNSVYYSDDRAKDYQYWWAVLGSLMAVCARGQRTIRDYQKDEAWVENTLDGMRAHLRCIHDVLDLWSL